MKNIKKVAYIIISLLIISFIGGVGYKHYSKNQLVNNFSDLISNYKQDISTYDLSDRAEEYENLIKECEQAIINKDNNEIKNLNVKLDSFKEELLNKNLEITNSNVNELENIDISKLEDKDSILSKIEEIKKLRDEKNFIQANELIATLSNDINNKLEIVKQEEAKKNEEEAIKNIDGTYKYEELNKNGVFIAGYNLSILNCSENRLVVIGGTGALHKIIINNEYIDIEEATKEEEAAGADVLPGLIQGDLEYVGDLTWQGFIWDDRNRSNTNIYGDNIFVPTIPIEIAIDKNNNDNISVTLGEEARFSGTKILTRDTSNQNQINSLTDMKNRLEADEDKISEREALELVEKEANAPEQYQSIRITLKHSFKPNVMWGLPDEEYYHVLYKNVTGINFLVGRESGAVYSIANQGYTPAKLMKDKNVVQVYEYIGE